MTWLQLGSPFSEAAHFTHRITIGSLKLAPGRRFLYLFDYGDDHRFTVEVRTGDETAPMADYPRVVGTHGRAPSQYGRWRSW